MKKWLFGIGIVLCLGVGGVAVYQNLKSDRTGPEITITGDFIYQDGMQEEELLQGVTAWDEQDGDVTDTIVVETVTVDSGDGTAVIYYAARDKENNVGKARRSVSYDPTGLTAQTEEETETETGKETGKGAETEKAVSAASGRVVSGTGNGAAGQNGTGNPSSEEESESESEIGEETETETEEETEEETEPESESEELESWQPVLRLNSLSATIKVGDTFDPLVYVASITDDYDNIYELWRDIQVEGEYDTTKAGNYELTYYVIDSSGYSSNRAKFLLRVKEN